MISSKHQEAEATGSIDVCIFYSVWIYQQFLSKEWLLASKFYIEDLRQVLHGDRERNMI